MVASEPMTLSDTQQLLDVIRAEDALASGIDRAILSV